MIKHRHKIHPKEGSSNVSLWESDTTSDLIYYHSKQFPNKFMVSFCVSVVFLYLCSPYVVLLCLFVYLCGHFEVSVITVLILCLFWLTLQHKMLSHFIQAFSSNVSRILKGQLPRTFWLLPRGHPGWPVKFHGGLYHLHRGKHTRTLMNVFLKPQPPLCRHRQELYNACTVCQSSCCPLCPPYMSICGKNNNKKHHTTSLCSPTHRNLPGKHMRTQQRG